MLQPQPLMYGRHTKLKTKDYHLVSITFSNIEYVRHVVYSLYLNVSATYRKFYRVVKLNQHVPVQTLLLFIFTSRAVISTNGTYK